VFHRQFSIAHIATCCATKDDAKAQLLAFLGDYRGEDGDSSTPLAPRPGGSLSPPQLRATGHDSCAYHAGLEARGNAAAALDRVPA